jgi:plasmid stabilization system protein ParE
MFTLKWSKEADRQYRELKDLAEKSFQARVAQEETKSSKAEGLFKQVHKALKLLRENPRHQGLRTHGFRSIKHPFDRKGKVFEAYGQNQTPGAYRVFWCYGPGKQEITIIAITPHP